MYAGPFGLAAILSGTVFIDRINTKSALDTMKSTVKRVKDERVSICKKTSLMDPIICSQEQPDLSLLT